MMRDMKLASLVGIAAASALPFCTFFIFGDRELGNDEQNYISMVLWKYLARFETNGEVLASGAAPWAHPARK